MRYVAILLSLLLSLSCSSKKESNTTTNINLKDGTWRVSYYWDQKDETSNFAGYALMFVDGGILMAHKGSSVYTGSWSETSTKITLTFTDPILSELNNDWLIVEKSNSLIKLKEDNPAQDDQLHLAKN
jgi:hypothetical protein